MENNKKTTQDVVHIATPHDYFGEKLSDQPIFGIKDFGGLKFKPIRSAYNGRAVFYMTDNAEIKKCLREIVTNYTNYKEFNEHSKEEREKVGV